MYLNIRKLATLVSWSVLLLCSLAACAPIADTGGMQEEVATDDNGSLPRDPEQTGQRYFDLLAQGKFDQAYDMWAPDTRIRESGRDQFEKSMLVYQSFEGETVGAARTEGAAGTLHAEVPVQVSGERRGKPFAHQGTLRLERCNDVPGCDEQARRWQIRAIDLEMN